MYCIIGKYKANDKYKYNEEKHHLFCNE